MNKIFSSAAVGAILIYLCTTACSLPNPYHATTTTQEASMDSTRGNGRYPADIDHLDDILSIGEGHELPEGAEVI